MNDWNHITATYERVLPEIMEARSRSLRGRTSPYFIDWAPLFTPIEFYAWCDIRRLGLPLYPQFPIAGKFVDFADPWFRIAIELDGAAYHDKKSDTHRDEDLWDINWRTFRIPGRESLPSGIDMLERGDYQSDIEFEDALVAWGLRWSEGFFWALRQFYYTESPKESFRNVARVILASHTIVSFPLELDGSDY